MTNEEMIILYVWAIEHMDLDSDQVDDILEREGTSPERATLTEAMRILQRAILRAQDRT